VTNHTAAAEILDFARSFALANLRQARQNQVHNGVVRSAQELFELAVKAGIRKLGADYPKVHDPAAGFVAVALAAGVRLTPDEARRLLEESKWLSDNRGPAFYLERSYEPEEAARAADAAEWALALIEERVFGGKP
jgi:HEPN domain-containing protein